MIEGDIKGCFDAIDHHVLMERVRRRIKDRKVLRLVLAFLKADIMIEGSLRHPVTGTPQGGVISPLLANIYLTAIDERYGRWVPAHAKDSTECGATACDTTANMAGRLSTWCATRMTSSSCAGNTRGCRSRAPGAGALPQGGTAHGAVDGKDQITDVREGFDFLGYRVVQKKVAPSTGRHVGKLFIPKGKLNDPARQDQGLVRRTPTGANARRSHRRSSTHHHRLAQLLPLCLRSHGDSLELDWWLRLRVGLWLRKKHDEASWKSMRHRFTVRCGRRRVWAEARSNSPFSLEAVATAYYPAGA